MTAALAMDLVRNAVALSLIVAAPLLVTALAVGVGVSLLQAVTQIQEQTLTFIPKLLLVAIVLVISLPWALTRLVEYVITILRSLPTLS